jgi:(1->4)-alpha-D-glucan 1-alpha-D-glucosylmutase
MCREMMSCWRDGRIKLWTILRVLDFRRKHFSIFQSGSYLPLSAAGDKQEHVVAFAREFEDESIVVAAPRLAYVLMSGEMSSPTGEVWGDSQLELPPGASEFLNIFTGERLSAPNSRTLLCREVFANFPVALLSSH